MLKLELHQHTLYSRDSSISYDDLLKAYNEGKFDVVAITDHDTLEGALAFKQKGDFPIIIGEEITTPGNKDIIGLFLSREVPPYLSVGETIAEIRRQGGLVMVPHPYQRLGYGIGEEAMLKYLAEIDIIETDNASGGEFMNRNYLARKFAIENDLIGVACSDSHFVNEIGKTVTLVEETDPSKLLTPQGLLEALKARHFSVNYISIFNHLFQRIYYSLKIHSYRNSHF